MKVSRTIRRSLGLAAGVALPALSALHVSHLLPKAGFLKIFWCDLGGLAVFHLFASNFSSRFETFVASFVPIVLSLLVIQTKFSPLGWIGLTIFGVGFVTKCITLNEAEKENWP